MSGRFFSVPFLICVLVVIHCNFTRDSLIGIGAVCVVLAFSVAHPTFLNDEEYEIDPVLDFAGRSKKTIVDHSGIADERAAFFQENGFTVNFRKGIITPRNGWVTLGTLEKRKKTKVMLWANIGYFGYFAGPRVHIIDPYGLGDPLISKMPIPDELLTSWRIGHFLRVVPNGYKESIEKDTNLLTDPHLATLYNAIHVITTGSILSFKRVKEIIKFNTGYYNGEINAYKQLPERTATQKDFMAFLASNPGNGINKSSYQGSNFHFYFNLFEETGQHRWVGQEWHRNTILPMWKKYKKAHNLINTKHYVNQDDFQQFLATKPFPGIDSTSYDYGNNIAIFDMFQETNGANWTGNEWHYINVLPKWVKFKKEHKLIDVPRSAHITDFQKFLSTNPHPNIDSSSYDYGKSTFYFDLFQNKGNWAENEWHRDSVLYLWNDYKKDRNLL